MQLVAAMDGGRALRGVARSFREPAGIGAPLGCPLLMVWLGFGSPAVAGPDACTGSGTATITCSGGQSQGIVVGSGGINANAAKLLSVGPLSTAIAASGAGIVWDVSSSNTQTSLQANIGAQLSPAAAGPGCGSPRAVARAVTAGR